MTCTVESFVDVLAAHVSAAPDRLAYRFVVDDVGEGATLNRSELDRRARGVAALLQDHRASGERVLLVYPPGLDFVVAVIGCLYAGAVAVPIYPPHPGRLDRARAHFAAIVADAEPIVVLTTDALRKVVANVLPDRSAQTGAQLLTTDTLDARCSDAWRRPALTGSDPAILQYTSGSTASPRGVVVTHANLLSNNDVIRQAFEVDGNACGMIWLPPYHDMGLVGGVLQPAFTGLPVVLMSPLSFLQRPIRWLETIARWRATVSGGPNFAYDLVVSRTTEEQRAALDLRSWRVAFTGAEPVRADTLDRFAAAFEVSGFRRTAFYPCYGLAEATLMVSGGDASRAELVAEVDATELEQGRARDAAPSTGRRLVGCGRARPPHEIRIVDANSRIECPDRTVGEIWVRGPSVASGYWRRPDDTEASFHATIAGSGEGPFLRTGDLGFFRADELFVTGRLKHLIIIDGRNHYPQDIEQTVERSHAAIRPGGAAAFTTNGSDRERLVVAVEVDRRFARSALPGGGRSGSESSDGDALVRTIRLAVAEEHDVRVHAVVLLPPGGVPRTGSGKIQRHLCRQAFETHAFETLEA